MTVSEVIRRVEQIRVLSCDDEVAHASEDALRTDVLAAIASGSLDAQGLAQIALLTSKISFSRWCA